MTDAQAPGGADARAELAAALGALRPALHRYCARLLGSVIEGEDVVQDAIVRALAAIDAGERPPRLRPWLFRIAHNRAIDLLRSRALGTAASLGEDVDPPDLETPDPHELLMRRERVGTAFAHFVDLPATQRSAVILKDVLGEPLQDIAELLDLSVDAVKAHLSRGRARLARTRESAAEADAPRPFSPEVLRFAGLFNARDWGRLRASLADDVRLHQSLHRPRTGAAEVGLFFTIYAQNDHVRLAPARLEGREVFAVFEESSADRPHHFMWLRWRSGRISFIRDYRYVPYILHDAGFEQMDDARNDRAAADG